jgi:thiol:disulfide interchange protein
MELHSQAEKIMKHFTQCRYIMLLLAMAAIFAGCAAPAALPTATPTVKPAPRKVAALPRPYNEQADPAQDIAAALKQAKADDKLVLLDFGANWCPDCLVLAMHFDNAQVKLFRSTLCRRQNRCGPMGQEPGDC